jgi:hypothetical protein
MKQEQSYPIVNIELTMMRKRILTSKAFKKWNDHIRTELKKLN